MNSLYNVDISKRDSVSIKFTCNVSLQVLLRSLKQETKETVQDPITQIIIIGHKNNNNQLPSKVACT